MVQDFWHTQDPSAPTALVKDADANAPGVHFVHAPTTDERILDFAIDAGFSVAGEIFDADHLAVIAAHFGYVATVHDDADLAGLCAVLDAEHPALVCFDANEDGDPHLAGGADAHWAAVTGWFEREGEVFVTAKHSWAIAPEHVWRAAEFLGSWGNVGATDFYSRVGRVPRCVSWAGPVGGKTPIGDRLALKIVEVVPWGVAPVGGRPPR